MKTPTGLSIESARQISLSFAQIRGDSRFVDLASDPEFAVDLRYGSTNNFMGLNVYGPQKGCYLHREAFLQLQEAGRLLRQFRPGFKLLIFDGLRPGSAQQILWSFVVGTPQQKYVAPPERGSIHSYGLAVDLSLMDSAGDEVDMGTVFDHFDELAEPQCEEKFLSEGKLTSLQVANRQLLRTVMRGAGFEGLPHEWWHFDALSPLVVRRDYELVK